MKDPADLLVPTTVQYELCKWVKRESDETSAHDTIALADNSLIAPLNTEIALMAADLTLSHKLAFADAVIYARANGYVSKQEMGETLLVAIRCVLGGERYMSSEIKAGLDGT